MSVTKELIKVADTFFKSNKYEEALEGYERVPQEERSARVLVNQSACLSHVGNFSQAEVVAREALVVKPDLVKGYLRLAEALKGQGKHKEAYEAIVQGMKCPSSGVLQPLAQSYFNLANGMSPVAPRRFFYDVEHPELLDHDHSHGHGHGHGHGHSHGHEHPHDHSHGHGHSHGHDHPHDHSHGHGHSHGHDHPHDHSHGHGHSHGHDHPPDHSHGHGHSHGHDHPHDHSHGHGRSHGHDHPHDHSHGHGHSHGHDHPHDHSHGHGHSHGHDHPQDHSHGHGRSHGHDHPHDHSHGHGHSHGHDHPQDHSHGHGHSHGHDHPQDHSHGHGHSHGHDHPQDHSHGHGRSHGHDHPHDHSHGHGHSHGHDHPQDHSHGHGHSHGHDYPHDHSHGHGHSHGHDHPPDHSHGHGHSHGHDHPQDHSHGHGHSHGHEHPPDHSPGHGHKQQSEPKFTFVELFAGIGGFRMSLEALGGKCVWACEINRKAAMTYNANFSSPPYHDIRRADLSLFPPFDICVGGFPCQDFSGLGEQKGLEGAKGALFYEVIRVLEHCRPPMILLENVKGLQNMHDGKVLDAVLGELRKLGYHVSTEVLNASCLVPQYRPRLYICGFLDPEAHKCHKFPQPPKFCPPRVVGDILHSREEEPFLDMYKLTTDQWRTVRKAKTSRKYGLQKRLVAPQDLVADTLIKSYRESRQSIAQFVCEGAKTDLIDELESEESASHEKLSKPEDHYNSHVRSGKVTIKNEVSRPRWFTPRECARLMGFPESFKLPPGGLPAYEQLGNAVVPPVITLLVSAMFAARDKLEHPKGEGSDGGWELDGLKEACRQVVNSFPPERCFDLCVATCVSHPLLSEDTSLNDVIKRA